jgi:hypothetical protein
MAVDKIPFIPKILNYLPRSGGLILRNFCTGLDSLFLSHQGERKGKKGELLTDKEGRKH